MIGRFQWVLRTARRHAGDRSRRSAAGFVRVLPDQPHRAQVKRWEDGSVVLSHDLVRRYETALDLPEGQLLRSVDLLAREDDPLRRGPALPPATVPDDVVLEAMPLLEKVLTYEPMTGVEWDRFSMLVSLVPHVLVRSRDWETLLHRLTLETSVSTGLEYAHRWEAAVRIGGDRAVTGVLIELIESALIDDDVQLYSDYATLLRYTPDPRGHDVLLRALTSPPNPRSLWASLSTATTLVRHGLVDHGVAREMLAVAAAVVADESQPLRTRKAGASLALRAETRSFPDRTGRGRRLRLTAQQRHEVRDVLAWTGLERERQDAVRAATLDALARETPSDARDPDLAALLDTALDEPHLDRRDTALAVLLLAPQGRTLGRVLAQDLAGAVDADDTGRAVADLSMLSFLAQPEDAGLLLDLALGRRGDPELMSHAGAALGNVPPPAPRAGTIDPELHAYAVAHLADPTAPRRAVDPGNAWGVCYALGMRGRFDLLQDLLERAHPRHDAAWVSALTWWATLPEVLRPPVPRAG